MPDDKMPFTQHLEELRKRLILCAASVGVGFLISFAFKEQIFAVLMKPWIKAMPAGHEARLIYTAPHEAFFTYMKVSLIAGTGLAVPVILYQLWRFIAPGLYENEKRYLLPVVFFSSVFFLGGALFGYFFVFPVGFQFFASFASDFITPMVTTREFLSFSMKLLLGFGFVFELPVFVFFLAKLGLVDAALLKRQRKVAIVLIFVVAAMLTPGPDVFSQLLMAGPLLILYEFSVWIAHFFGRKKEVEDPSARKQPDSAA
ncbi:MAG: twin-arginine translocase subunit TatC [Syntrophobacteraceae bacterium]|nr:twin-arginine translocase subunit TatC [Syntrophobacteraceae bacterium]